MPKSTNQQVPFRDGPPLSSAEVIAKLYAPWLRAIADCKVIQSCAEPSKIPGKTDWVDCDPLMLLLTMSEGTFSEKYLRVKPPTIMIGEVEVPAPLIYPPAAGSTVWSVSWEYQEYVFAFAWEGNVWQLKLLRAAVLWDSHDGAVQAANAIVTLLRQGSNHAHTS